MFLYLESCERVFFSCKVLVEYFFAWGSRLCRGGVLDVCGVLGVGGVLGGVGSA